MTFLPVREHGNSIKFHKYFDIRTQAKLSRSTLFSFIHCISTIEALRAETHHEPSCADFLIPCIYIF